MKEKRRVSKNLGRTQHRDADRIYNSIRKRIGSTRVCPFYKGTRYAHLQKTGHNKLNSGFPNPQVPIEQFDFQWIAKKKWWGLQAYCKVCYKAYRDARIGRARNTWKKRGGKPMSDDDIRQWYIKNVGPTMRCSACGENVVPSGFRISRSMEKGLHNICIACSVSGGASLREQIWLADGDWSSWRKVVFAMRKNKQVICGQWPRAVASGACKLVDDGKAMHADHKVPLRCGGLHDARNFQPLCGPCNSKKSDQLDPSLSATEVRRLVGTGYKHAFNLADDILTIERKLKARLVRHMKSIVTRGLYQARLKLKKKRVNGQWDLARAEKKGHEWLQRGDAVLE